MKRENSPTLDRRWALTGDSVSRSLRKLSRGYQIWRVLLAVGLSLAAVYVVIPYGLAASTIYVGTTLMTAVSVGLAVRRRNAIFCPTAWTLIACALALATIGHAIWYWLDIRGLEPFPSLADAFYIGVYPLFILALWLLGRRNDGGGGAALSDALIVGISAAVLGWALLIAPYVYDPSLTLGQLLISTAYPVADLMVLPLILRLVFLYRSRILAHLLLLAGMVAYLSADMLYAHGNAVGWYLPGGLTDGLWLLAYTFFAAAVWHPSAAEKPRAHASSARFSSRRLIILGAAAVLPPGIILLTAGANFDIVRVAAIGSILIFLLVLHRMAGLIKRSHQQAEALEHLSRTDPLTGAANRRHLEQTLAYEVSRADRAGGSLSLAYLDLDHFKRFNDTYGHAMGDALLQNVVSRWREILRPTDLLVRIGGEEFVVLFPDTDAGQCRTVVERLRRAVPDEQTCSAGIAEHRRGDGGSTLLGRADGALYKAKRQGRNRAVLAVGSRSDT